MAAKIESLPITLLDGGMGREILRMGAPFGQPEWSAMSLMQAPELVRKAHESFAAAGCDILTTSNYAVVPFHLGDERFQHIGAELTALAGRLARQASAATGCRVAGSIPPLFGSYRPDLFQPELAPSLLAMIVSALGPHIDLWLGETISSIREAEAIAAAVRGDNRPLWLSFSLLDGPESSGIEPRLRSGESVIQAAAMAAAVGAAAILFNCSQPEAMAPAITAARQEISRLHANLAIGVYANAFPAQNKDARANSTIMEIRGDLDPAGYLGFVTDWCRLGATIVGGCCGIGPEHINLLHQFLRGGFPPSQPPSGSR